MCWKQSLFLDKGFAFSFCFIIMPKNKPASVQPSSGRLGMSHRPRHSRFKSPLEVSLDYLIHSFSVWGYVSVIYFPLYYFLSYVPHIYQIYFFFKKKKIPIPFVVVKLLLNLVKKANEMTVTKLRWGLMIFTMKWPLPKIWCFPTLEFCKVDFQTAFWTRSQFNRLVKHSKRVA